MYMCSHTTCERHWEVSTRRRSRGNWISEKLIRHSKQHFWLDLTIFKLLQWFLLFADIYLTAGHLLNRWTFIYSVVYGHLIILLFAGHLFNRQTFINVFRGHLDRSEVFIQFRNKFPLIRECLTALIASVSQLFRQVLSWPGIFFPFH
jgi:hypothetical protein